MCEQKKSILIIGAGLTGLALNYFLRDSAFNITILEARERIGGRIHTVYSDEQSPLEMGATWLGRKHTSLIALLEELEIDIFEQEIGRHAIFHPVSTSPPYLSQLPENNDPSYRIRGGTSSLINRLAEFVKEGRLSTGVAVSSIEARGKKLVASSASQEYEADYIVSTLPPNLFCKSIEVTPNLPDELIKIATSNHTWMGESIKVGLAFEKPFWKAENSSGTIFSNTGAIPEMYDHSNPEQTLFALKGFMNDAYFPLIKEERLDRILQQLEQYYGKQVRNYLSYHETVWRDEPFTYTAYNSPIMPHQNNGHPIFREPYLDGRLLIAGAETAYTHPGYMDGAVESARFCAGRVNNM